MRNSGSAACKERRLLGDGGAESGKRNGEDGL